MNLTPEEVREKIELLWNIEKLVHLTLIGGTWLRGKITQIPNKEGLFIIDDLHKGNIVIDIKLVADVEIYIPKRSLYVKY